MQPKYIESNRKNWNERVPFHMTSELYAIEDFKKGKRELRPFEKELFGHLKGKKVVHLMCHIGLDTISLAKEGAEVTGLDLADDAIVEAKKLAQECKVKVNFVAGNVYEADKILTEKFDIVYLSYGVLCWLNDLTKLFEVVKNLLVPGGRFVLIDDHPFLAMLNKDLQIEHAYFSNNEPERVEPEGTYADRTADIKTESYQWWHNVADIINSVKAAGLTLESFNEYPFGFWPRGCTAVQHCPVRRRSHRQIHATDRADHSERGWDERRPSGSRPG